MAKPFLVESTQPYRIQLDTATRAFLNDLAKDEGRHASDIVLSALSQYAKKHHNISLQAYKRSYRYEHVDDAHQALILEQARAQNANFRATEAQKELDRIKKQVKQLGIPID